MIIPYGANDNLPLLPANTKTTIIATRWVQFAFRVLQLIGALGLLACVICIKDIDGALTWLLRIPVSQSAFFVSLVCF